MEVARYYANAIDNQPDDYMQYENMELNWGYLWCSSLSGSDPSIRTPDRYEIVEKVGRGKYSEVFQAVDLKTNQYVSIKYLKPVRKKKIRRYVLRALSLDVLTSVERSRSFRIWMVVLTLFPYVPPSEPIRLSVADWHCARSWDGCP